MYPVAFHLDAHHSVRVSLELFDLVLGILGWYISLGRKKNEREMKK